MYAYSEIDPVAEEVELVQEELRKAIGQYRVALFHEHEAKLTGNTYLLDRATANKAEAAAKLAKPYPTVSQEELDATTVAVTRSLEESHFKAVREGDAETVAALETILAKVAVEKGK